MGGEMCATAAWRPLLGRDHEVGLILAGYHGGTAQGVVLSGAKGVGKSALADAAAAGLAADGCPVASVGAARALRSTPFAAIACLAPGVDDGYALLASLVERFHGIGPRRAVVVVDDAHLLDEESAAVLATLTARQLIFLIASTALGAPVPEALGRLWTGGDVIRLTVRPLAAEAMGQLVHRLAGNRTDPIGRHRLQRLAAGNPLALRMLLDTDAEDADAARNGLVRGLIEPWLNDQGPQVRRVVDIVACAGPLPLYLLESLVDPAAVDAAEQAGMVDLAGDGDTVLARLASPLSAPVVRPLVARSAARQIFAELALRLLRGRPLRGEDKLRAGTWQMCAERFRSGAYLLPAARRALAKSDLDLAGRLAEAARRTCPGTAADLLYAQVLVLLGHRRRAADALPPVPPRDDEEAAIWALLTAEIRYFGLGRPAAEAERVLANVGHGRDRAEAKRSWIELADGRGAQALSRAQSVLACPDADPQARVWAAAGGTAAAAVLGHRSLSEAIFRRGADDAERARGRFPWDGARAGYGLCLARLLAGDLPAAQDSADRGYQEAVCAEARPPAAVWAWLRGMIAKARGRLHAAALSLREALALLDGLGPACLRIAVMTELASVTAMAGGAAEAADWLARVDACADPRPRLFAPWIEIGRAWSQACAGELSEAITHARHAADLARDQGHAAYEASALYDVARLGGAGLVCARLARLARTVEGDAVVAMASAAKALAARDGAGLSRATDTFEDLGHLPLAAETAAAAAHAQRLAGRHAPALVLQERSNDLARRCQNLHTPLLDRRCLDPLLTSREREVVLMAATLTTPQIAERLRLSPRTVSNYLQHAYDKLGLAGRPALRMLLGGWQPGNADGPGPLDRRARAAD